MFVLRSLRLLVLALTAESSHRQIAGGIALGLIVGLVPKGNLLALGLLTLASAIKISLPGLFFSIFLFSWLALLLDPLTHRLGEALLAAPLLQSFWVWLYQWPGVPWTQFNNTIVLGSLVLGLLLAGPLYAASLPVIQRYEPGCRARIKKYRLARWLFGAEWAEKVRAAL